MIRPIVPTQQNPAQLDPQLDPLSEILSLIKPHINVAGGFAVAGEVSILFPRHKGVKCYAMLSGDCWLILEGMEPLHLDAGDCFLLPHGIPFQLSTDPALKPMLYTEARERLNMRNDATDGARYIAGGHFALSGDPAEMLLQALPPIVHLRSEQDKAAMRWSLERMREELSNPQPGNTLITQQLAYMMLIQALRLHLADAGHGWLAALSDPQMSRAITDMHGRPGHPWTVQTLAESVGMSRSVFALRFREIVGSSPMEYLTRWRMLLAADRLKSSTDTLSAIAESLGYDSDSAFGKAFRRVMGCSPRQYARATPLNDGAASPILGN